MSLYAQKPRINRSHRPAHSGWHPVGADCNHPLGFLRYEVSAAKIRVALQAIGLARESEMLTVVIVIHLMIVLAMIGVVLLQKSEGGGFGMGGGGAGGFLSSRGTANIRGYPTA
jgi:Preprotein translocase SecG subunit